MDRDGLFDTQHLLRQVETGDEVAIRRLYERYIRRAEAWTRGRIPGSARNLFDTQGVAHDVLVRSLLRASEGAGLIRSSFRSYVLRAIRNRLIDLGRAPDRSGSLLDEDLAAEELDPVERLIEEEVRRGLERGIARLPRDQQDLLRTRFEHECTYAVIAERLGLDSEDAARMRVNRALQRLRAELEPPK